jgi:hypothetical protein
LVVAAVVTATKFFMCMIITKRYRIETNKQIIIMANLS